MKIAVVGRYNVGGGTYLYRFAARHDKLGTRSVLL
jgi:hypothetical protein